MALIVEDGTVVAGADSFLSLIDARTTASNYGIALPVDDTEAEVSLRQGYLNLLNQERYLQGSRVSADQTGIYPRTGAYNNCFPVASDSIPEEVKLSQLYAAEAISQGTSVNESTSGEALKSFDVKGVYSETYQDNSRANLNATIQGVVNTIYPLTKSGFAASPCGGGSGGLNRENMGYLG